jgi:hypothetical protein
MFNVISDINCKIVLQTRKIQSQSNETGFRYLRAQFYLYMVNKILLNNTLSVNLYRENTQLNKILSLRK